ncbi:Thiol-disulfide oxidoreductase ResA [Jeotgalicoccus saudimassiliensis]|uniref:Thiol-disulfide oxidoreductase ResA n=1 Tax=Jeotgalicoccus saudimassiliensis TaxID=1461582 RepID=A0A078LYH4_9STAP|nr:TlpA disulfide reductase family protein [Jeotgalicoccus saudimassiliensis]CDZ99069.1 Thiol-disulfide oxidoreductase ResA [Jeotgalicoccus saudimassiliensis]
MTGKKLIIAVVFIAFFLLIGISIGAVINMSDDQMRERSLKTLQDSEGRDNHHAVGLNLLNTGNKAVINSDEPLEEIIKNNEVTVVNFFASWCEPCKRETPELNEYAMETAESDIQVVGINIDDSVKNRDAFLDTYDVQYPVFELTDEAGMTDEFKISLMPTTFFVDSNGEVVRAYIGEIGPELITNYINYVKERQ